MIPIKLEKNEPLPDDFKRVMRFAQHDDIERICGTVARFEAMLSSDDTTHLSKVLHFSKLWEVYLCGLREVEKIDLKYRQLKDF